VRTLAAAALVCLWAGEAVACRLALALGLDISSSVNSLEYAIQKDGLAAALRSEDVRSALLGQAGEVRVAVFEWSGYPQQDVVVDWTPILSSADIDALAARVDGHRRAYAEFATAVGKAVEYGALMLRRAGRCERRVLDLSGDGAHNEGPEAEAYATLLGGITINALVIKGAFPDPEDYYRDHVIRGPGAFTIVARNGFEDYPDLIRGKLLREIEPPMLTGSIR